MCALALLAAVTVVAPVSASRLTVPDDSPTIQGALDALPDTVLVRSGRYAESLVLFSRVALLGIPEGPGFERPIVSGMTLGSVPGYVAEFRVRGLEFSGQIRTSCQDGPSQIVLENCRLRGGLLDLFESPDATQLRIKGCQFDQDLVHTDGGLLVDSCVFQGSHLVAGGDDCGLTVKNSEFHGDGTRSAITIMTSELSEATVTGNLMEGYGSGLYLGVFHTLRIEDNVVRDMVGGGIGTGGAARAYILRNRVERCGGQYGIGTDRIDELVLQGNTVANCTGSGMLAMVSSRCAVVDNVVWGCRYYGIHLGEGGASLLEVKNNTSSLNGWTGFQSEVYVSGGRYEFEGNIGFGNGRYGVEWGVTEVTTVRCNDWFGNGLGTVNGLPMSSEDRAVDPQFCGAANGDFRLASTSPLVNPSGCGQVGALGVGCNGTSRLTVLGQNPSRGPVRIEFELAVPAAIEIDVFDLQGRRVATLAQGTWPAGTHAVEWAGRSGSSRLAVGIYVVRYRHPGGEDKRRIVLTP